MVEDLNVPQWNHDLLNRFLAPGIAEFKEAEIPDIAKLFPEHGNWLKRHFLNSVFGVRFSGKSRHLVANFLYRAQTCLVRYDGGRRSTLELFDKSEPSNPASGRYFAALADWESSLIAHSIAIDLLRAILETDLFKKEDGSELQRAYDAANEIKHYRKTINTVPSEAVDAPLIPGPEDERPLFPIWLTNQGMQSTSFVLSFADYAACVQELAKSAEILLSAREFLEGQESQGELKTPG